MNKVSPSLPLLPLNLVKKKVGATMALGSNKLEPGKKNRRNQRLPPPVRGQIKRQILACIMRNVKLGSRNSLKFLLCKSGHRSELT
ncbi:hypothetical protein DKX38_011654 [Salix brachista]|uniref:Uncharacterized protein n=1 Tax=Salix brachista TaxID=2182728 RepID=A0A5N5LZX3_9ROSI|nr:hypothetical protein DKX38_011654 [Salix brachista]